MPIAPRAASVTCPACGTQFNVQVHTIIDVGQDPQQKQQFLSGQLNQAACPQCGAGGMLATPFLYHDPGKQLALVFLPTNLNLPEDRQQRLIGQLTNEVMMSVPPEERRSYLFQPEIFFRIEGLMKRILAADGITEEMLAAQEARVALIEEFLEAGNDEDKLRSLADEHRQSLDYSFFQTLTANLEAAESAEDTELAQRLLELRSRLLELSDLGRSSRAQQDLYEALEEGLSREELLKQLMAAEGEPELEGMVSVARSLIDYQFFMMLTQRMESAAEPEAQELQALREQLLKLVEQLDQEAQEALAHSSQVLQAIMESEDLEAAVHDHLAEIDDLLLGVLSTSMRQARAERQTERAERLQEIWDAIISTLEQAMPPEIQLINRLLNAQTPGDRRALVEGQSELIGSEFLELMEAMAADLAERGQPDAADRLRAIRTEVAEFAQSQTSPPVD